MLINKDGGSFLQKTIECLLLKLECLTEQDLKVEL
jgi:hypothetical protein